MFYCQFPLIFAKWFFQSRANFAIQKKLTAKNARQHYNQPWCSPFFLKTGHGFHGLPQMTALKKQSNTMYTRGHEVNPFRFPFVYFVSFVFEKAIREG
jgi:hypothetical protein